LSRPRQIFSTTVATLCYRYRH